MNPVGQRKCAHYNQLFLPDPRQRERQRYCVAPACRRVSKAASQARWLGRPENRDYFRGPENVARVQAWRAAHPGYGRGPRKAPAALPEPLQEPALNVAGCALALEKVFARADLPRGVFQVLLVADAAASRLIADRRVQGVTLTGSTRAGKAVAALADAAMKPGVFELGGSDPAIVLEDADIARAAEVCAHSRLLNSGQSCVCAKRFIVVRSVLREFERAFTAHMAARRTGDPADLATDVGPLARADLRAALDAQVRRSVALGARVLLGGAPLPGAGFFYPPTVLANVRPGMPAFDEELFGPVAAIVGVRDAAEAVRVANASRFGLGASVFTRRRTRARRLARELETAAVFINDFVRSMPELPFGGVKESGHGRELGQWGARAFVNVKTVWEA